MSHTASKTTAEKPQTNRRGFSEIEASIYLGISRASLRQGRMEGKRDKRLPPPPYVRLGRKILYLKDDLDNWLEQHRQAA